MLVLHPAEQLDARFVAENLIRHRIVEEPQAVCCAVNPNGNAGRILVDAISAQGGRGGVRDAGKPAVDVVILNHARKGGPDVEDEIVGGDIVGYDAPICFRRQRDSVSDRVLAQTEHSLPRRRQRGTS